MYLNTPFSISSTRITLLPVLFGKSKFIFLSLNLLKKILLLNPINPG